MLQQMGDVAQSFGFGYGDMLEMYLDDFKFFALSIERGADE